MIGTVAMIKHAPGIYELAKMAVTEKHQGKQAGRKLADIALKKAKQRKAKQIFLMTSPKLKKASNLYSEIGFKKANKPPVKLPEFERCSIPMLLKYRK